MGPQRPNSSLILDLLRWAAADSEGFQARLWLHSSFGRAQFRFGDCCNYLCALAAGHVVASNFFLRPVFRKPGISCSCNWSLVLCYVNTWCWLMGLRPNPVKRFRPTFAGMRMRSLLEPLGNLVETLQGSDFLGCIPNTPRKGWHLSRFLGEGCAVRCFRKPSKTLLQVVGHVTKAHRSFSMLVIRIVTGRKHQIRSHLAWWGHPSLCDARWRIGREDTNKIHVV